MKKTPLIIIALFVLVSCKNRTAYNYQDIPQMSKIVPLQERTPIHLSFDETELPDTLSYSNIIEKVRFIPLETRKEAFIERVLKIAIMGPPI